MEDASCAGSIGTTEADRLSCAVRPRDLIQPECLAGPIQRMRTARKWLHSNEFHLVTTRTVYPVGKVIEWLFRMSKLDRRLATFWRTAQ